MAVATTLTHERVVIADALTWRQIGAIAQGADLELSSAARARICAARGLVEAIVDSGTRAYGVTTGVGALCNVVVDVAQQRRLSRNIVMSHAVGVGSPLARTEVRAIMASAVNNFAHGFSGVRAEVVDRLIYLLVADCIPDVPSAGSVGYLSHMAHIALVVIGEGFAWRSGARRGGAEMLAELGTSAAVLEAKEGLSLVNGTPCATGLGAWALTRAERLLDWADVTAALSLENLHAQTAAFDAETLRLRASPALQRVGARLRALLQGSAILAASTGERTQDALSLRAVPHVHGAARDTFEYAAASLDCELASVTDNPVVVASPLGARALSEAHAVGAALGISCDALCIAMAEVAAMSERRIDRLVNPLVSGLPAFLAADSGAASGFMIAQYTAASLVADNRRLSAPASLDGGVTSGLQEDHLAHATPAALKLLRVLDNVECILAIELLAAAQAYELQPTALTRAPGTDAVYRWMRERVAHYDDSRPLGFDIECVRHLLVGTSASAF